MQKTRHLRAGEMQIFSFKNSRLSQARKGVCREGTMSGNGATIIGNPLHFR
jgi:hypothetical protein